MTHLTTAAGLTLSFCALVAACAGATPTPAIHTPAPRAPIASPTPAVDLRHAEWIDLDTFSIDAQTAVVRRRTPNISPESIVGDDIIVGSDISGLVGMDRRSGEARWRVQDAASHLLQRLAGDSALGLRETVLAVDDRPSLPASAHRYVVSRATADGREIFRHPLPDDAIPHRTTMRDGRLLVIEGPSSTTVVDAWMASSGPRKRGRLPLGIAQTFNESVRWIDGYRWSSGDLILTSDQRIARIEFTSTSPDAAGSTVWSLPPLQGSRGGGLLTGAVDESPNSTAKYICFYGYDPDTNAPIQLAIVEALARTQKSVVVEPLSVPCAHREVRLVEESSSVFAVFVACDRGGIVEHRQLPSGMLLHRTVALRDGPL